MTSPSLTGPRRVTSAVRQALPRGAAETARGVLLGWGRATWRFRLLPSVIIVGAQRAGTTTLFRVLADHPQVRRPTFTKGTRYFESGYHRGPRWYRAHFPIAFGDHITFESNGYYSFHPLAAERIGRDLPGVRVVMMVRDPVERAFSAYKHALARGLETESFEAALELESDRIAGEMERIENDPSYESFSLRHHAYVTRGRYAEQLDRLASTLGEQNVFVMDADLFFADPSAEFNRLNRWLGLAPWLPQAVEQWNARRSAPMPEAIRERLWEYFEPYDKDLQRFLGKPPSWRQVSS